MKKKKNAFFQYNMIFLVRIPILLKIPSKDKDSNAQWFIRPLEGIL